MIPIALWLLATLDCAFCGYRAAAGRNALIDKRAYYRAALLRGAILGQAAVAIAGAALLLAYAWDGEGTWPALMTIGRRMLAVYVPYAFVLLVTFAVRTLPSVDVRSLTSTLVFGPLALIRPLVVVGGLVYGVAAAQTPARLAVALLIATMMLGAETALGLARGPRRP